MTERVPLSTLLGQLVVAHTIEVDGLFEQRMPHSTTLNRQPGRPSPDPWLVSYVMWCNVLRHVDADGITIAELQRRAAMPKPALRSRLNGVSRWRYVTVQASGSARSQQDAFVTLTRGGVQACETFAPLPAEVEQRWSDRFGSAAITRLRAALEPFVETAPADLPRYLPVVSGELRSEVVLSGASSPQTGRQDLLTLLAQTLLLFTLEVGRESVLSLPLLANVVRVLGRRPVALRDVPLLAGVSKEAVSMALTHLVKAGLVEVTGAGVSSTPALTEAGSAAQQADQRRVDDVEQAWATRGPGDLAALRAASEELLEHGRGPDSLMAEGLRPHEGAWRAHPRYRAHTEALLADPRAALPHHPMVLHRGGYPDGS